MDSAAEESVYCLKCGSPAYLKPVEALGPVHTEVVEEHPDLKDWFIYKIQCFKCGGKQLLNHPSADLVEPPAPPFAGDANGLAAPTGDLTALANSGKSLASS